MTRASSRRNAVVGVAGRGWKVSRKLKAYRKGTARASAQEAGIRGGLAVKRIREETVRYVATLERNLATLLAVERDQLALLAVVKAELVMTTAQLKLSKKWLADHAQPAYVKARDAVTVMELYGRRRYARWYEDHDFYNDDDDP